LVCDLARSISCRRHRFRSASLSFSLIRGRSLGFTIGCHACNGRRSGLNIDEWPRAVFFGRFVSILRT
jgi:hypothetical protein